jgi:long-chain acyl-CoA synthetase
MAHWGEIVQPKFIKKPPFSVDAPGYEKVEGEGIPRRHPAAKDKLLTRPVEEIGTIFDIIRYSAKKFGNAKSQGTRKIIDTHHEIKKVTKIVDGKEQVVDKKWTYFELSEYSYISFNEYEKLILKIGAGLRKLGLVKDDRLHIFAATT